MSDLVEVTENIILNKNLVTGAYGFPTSDGRKTDLEIFFMSGESMELRLPHEKWQKN